MSAANEAQKPEVQPSAPRSADDARDRFGDAIDGLLSESEQRAFDALLEGDAELRDEYESYRAIVKGVGSAVVRVAGADEGTLESGEKEKGVELAPSLVPKVQERIRKRSKGRYFRDRFSSGEAKGSGLTVMLVTASLLIVIAVWLMLDNIELLSP